MNQKTKQDQVVYCLMRKNLDTRETDIRMVVGTRKAADKWLQRQAEPPYAIEDRQNRQVICRGFLYYMEQRKVR